MHNLRSILEVFALLGGVEISFVYIFPLFFYLFIFELIFFFRLKFYSF